MGYYEIGCADLGSVVADDVVDLVDDDITERAQRISNGFGHRHCGGKCHQVVAQWCWTRVVWKNK